MLMTVVIAAVVIAIVLFLVLREGAGSKDGSQRQSRRATGIRRSPRVPISIPVAIRTEEEHFHGKGQNISHGGMLVHAEAPLSVSQPIQVNFTLPDAAAISIPAVVSYKKGVSIGLRFDPTHHERHSIEKWVNSSVKEQAKV
jgi:PilZ domain